MPKPIDPLLNAAEGRAIRVGRLDPAAFVAGPRSASAVISSGERRLHGGVTLSEGVIRPWAGAA